MYAGEYCTIQGAAVIIFYVPIEHPCLLISDRVSGGRKIFPFSLLHQNSFCLLKQLRI